VGRPISLAAFLTEHVRYSADDIDRALIACVSRKPKRDPFAEMTKVERSTLRRQLRDRLTDLANEYLARSQYYALGRSPRAELNDIVVLRRTLKDASANDAATAMRAISKDAWLKIIAHGKLPAAFYEWPPKADALTENPDQLGEIANACRVAEAALKLWIESNPRQRGPRHGVALAWFIRELAVVYQTITGAPAGLSTLDPNSLYHSGQRRGGPFFRFVEACLAPLSLGNRPTTAAIAQEVRRIIGGAKAEK
jgi:hypothetical protein